LSLSPAERGKSKEAIQLFPLDEARTNIATNVSLEIECSIVFEVLLFFRLYKGAGFDPFPPLTLFSPFHLPSEVD